MKKFYFIDSENVGDTWTALLSSVSADDVLLVFYTAGSPHMSYSNVIAIKESDRKMEFIECFCGKNGLDFQLSSELGSRIPSIGNDAFVIVSNDTGFDVVVRYWQKRGKSVSRMNGSGCKFIDRNEEITETAPIGNPPPLPEKPERSPQEDTALLASMVVQPLPAQEPVSSADAGTLPAPVQTASRNSDVNVPSSQTKKAQPSENSASQITAKEVSPSETNTSLSPQKPAQPTDAGAPPAPVQMAARNPDVNVPAPQAKKVQPSESSTSQNTAKAVPTSETNTSLSPQGPAQSTETGALPAPVQTAARSSDVNVPAPQAKKAQSSKSKASQITAKAVQTSETNTSLPPQKPAQPAEAGAGASPVDDNAKEILYLIGRDNLQYLHESLQQLYGAKQGQTIYNALKPNTAYTEFLSKHRKLTVNDKQRQYCSIVFSVSAPDDVMPEDFSGYIIESWKKKKNLNTLKSLLVQRYGKEKGDRYYMLFKIHIKILSQLK